jgi:hypothetical protein
MLTFVWNVFGPEPEVGFAFGRKVFVTRRDVELEEPAEEPMDI